MAFNRLLGQTTSSGRNPASDNPNLTQLELRRQIPFHPPLNDRSRSEFTMELNAPSWGTPTHPVIGGTANQAPESAVHHTEQSPQQSGPGTDPSMADFNRRLSRLEERDRDRESALTDVYGSVTGLSSRLHLAEGQHAEHEQNNQRRHDQVVGLLNDNRNGWADVTNRMDQFQSQREAEAWTAQQRHEQLRGMLDDHGNALMDANTRMDQVLGVLENQGNALAGANTRIDKVERKRKEGRKRQKQREQKRRQRQADEQNQRRVGEMFGLISQGMQMAAQNMGWRSSAHTSHGPHAQGHSIGAVHPPFVPAVNNLRGSKGRGRKRCTVCSERVRGEYIYRGPSRLHLSSLEVTKINNRESKGYVRWIPVC
ncbi:hypothetical protein P167DRAFT_273114 [Morchella conica CCBAS932]|uniref:Uncharacterized protein n=1 Tax=Morchella conica CCBAS932 TaxID=1392247 RepID=A0A3N4KKG1_9PEZI|nr:hypothetical protein P167DRAFT_273114 [Morchella conica CCBAS932]